MRGEGTACTYCPFVAGLGRSPETRALVQHQGARGHQPCRRRTTCSEGCHRTPGASTGRGQLSDEAHSWSSDRTGSSRHSDLERIDAGKTGNSTSRARVAPRATSRLAAQSSSRVHCNGDSHDHPCCEYTLLLFRPSRLHRNVPPRTVSNSVSTGPGHTWVTTTPVPARSARSASPNPSMKCLLAV